MSQSQFRVEPDELRAYALYMRDVASSFNRISSFIDGEGANISGFTGLLSVLTQGVTLMSDAVNAALNAGMGRLEGSAEALERSARNYEATDQATAAVSDATIIPDVPDPVGSD
jgi:Excreted virulence factor EspC, type VII ESX diderm